MGVDEAADRFGYKIPDRKLFRNAHPDFCGGDVNAPLKSVYGRKGVGRPPRVRSAEANKTNLLAELVITMPSAQLLKVIFSD
jgi:hypothetical protein